MEDIRALSSVQNLEYTPQTATHQAQYTYNTAKQPNLGMARSLDTIKSLVQTGVQAYGVKKKLDEKDLYQQQSLAYANKKNEYLKEYRTLQEDDYDGHNKLNAKYSPQFDEIIKPLEGTKYYNGLYESNLNFQNDNANQQKERLHVLNVRNVVTHFNATAQNMSNITDVAALEADRKASIEYANSLNLNAQEANELFASSRWNAALLTMPESIGTLTKEHIQGLEAMKDYLISKDPKLKGSDWQVKAEGVISQYYNKMTSLREAQLTALGSDPNKIAEYNDQLKLMVQENLVSQETADIMMAMNKHKHKDDLAINAYGVSLTNGGAIVDSSLAPTSISGKVKKINTNVMLSAVQRGDMGTAYRMAAGDPAVFSSVVKSSYRSVLGKITMAGTEGGFDPIGNPAHTELVQQLDMIQSLALNTPNTPLTSKEIASMRITSSILTDTTGTFKDKLGTIRDFQTAVATGEFSVDVSDDSTYENLVEDTGVLDIQDKADLKAYYLALKTTGNLTDTALDSLETAFKPKEIGKARVDSDVASIMPDFQDAQDQRRFWGNLIDPYLNISRDNGGINTQQPFDMTLNKDSGILTITQKHGSETATEHITLGKEVQVATGYYEGVPKYSAHRVGFLSKEHLDNAYLKTIVDGQKGLNDNDSFWQKLGNDVLDAIGYVGEVTGLKEVAAGTMKNLASKGATIVEAADTYVQGYRDVMNFATQAGSSFITGGETDLYQDFISKESSWARHKVGKYSLPVQAKQELNRLISTYDLSSGEQPMSEETFNQFVETAKFKNSEEVNILRNRLLMQHAAYNRYQQQQKGQ